MDFLEADTPNFVWKNQNALLDYDCIIENELPEIKPKPRVKPVSVLGKNGEFHEWFGDYEGYDLKVDGITIPYERLHEVKQWLTGFSQLITHNDRDKYREAWVTIDNETTFKNEWGVYYTFSVTFRCQPFRRKIQEPYVPLFVGKNEVFDHGQERAFPFIEIQSNKKQDIVITVNNRLFRIKEADKGKLQIDSDKKIVVQGNKKLVTVGEFPVLTPGKNSVELPKDIKETKILKRSVWL